MIYSGPDRYAVKAIGMAKIRRKIVGFVCLRHCIRKPYTIIYDVGVLPEEKRKGIGKALVNWAFSNSPHGAIRLNVDVRNKEAIEFYELMEFSLVERGQWKNGDKYFTMELV